MKFKYLKHFELPYKNGNIIWSICPYTGHLLKASIPTEKKTNSTIPTKVSLALEYCNNPYLCNLTKEVKVEDDNVKLFNDLNKMHESLLKIGNNRFFLTRLYSSMKNFVFENTIEAISHINRLSPQIAFKHKLCLQRAFLSAKISQSFTSDGVIFIGAFLPTGDMHAWIIENGRQPDYDDRGWINYRPLLAFYH